MDEPELDAALEPALDGIDRATLALHMSGMARRRVDRIEQARVACATYEEALKTLSALSQEVQRTQAWQHWTEEARHCLTLARNNLQRPGA
jgi:hypothetical protein